MASQTLQKSTAAVHDIEFVRDNGLQAIPTPQWLAPSWGNNGVNPAIKNASALDGASAAANIAANIALLVNQKPKELYKPSKAREAALAARSLTEKLLGTSSTPANAKDIQNLQNIMFDGLRDVVKRFGEPLKDKTGKDIALEDYIAARSQEVEAGAAKAIAAARTRGQEGTNLPPPPSLPGGPNSEGPQR